MDSQEMIEVIGGDDETIPYKVLSFAGMNEEFEDVDLANLKTSEIMDIACENADDWDQEEFDSGLPGGCYGLFRFYAKDPEKFREKLASALRPLCRKLAGSS